MRDALLDPKVVLKLLLEWKFKRPKPQEQEYVDGHREIILSNTFKEKMILTT